MAKETKSAPKGVSRRSVLSIRWIVAIAAAVLTTLVVLGVTGVMERRTRSVLRDEIEARLLAEARNLALASTRALLTDYPELLLAPLVKEMHSGQSELTFIAVVDRSGIVQGHPDVRQIGTAFALPQDLRPVASTVSRGRGESLTENAAMLLVSVPILDPNGRVLGNAHVGLRRGHIEQAVSRVSRQQYLILAAFLLAGVAASFVLMSVLLRPIGALRAGIERIGHGDLSTPVALTDRTEFGLLADAINEMSSELGRAQGEMVERARLAHEMELAREIQRSLLPSKQTVAGEFVIDGEQWAATEVGGDYFDVLPLPGGKIAFAVADVSGKGLAGCLVTSMLFSLLRAYHATHASPASLLAALDERLGGILKRGNFVTMFYGVLDPATGEVVYSSAGHNPTLVYRAEQGRSEWFRSKGIPLGAIRGGAIRCTLEDSVIHLAPGDILLQFTDGINETMAPGGQEQFGFGRMEKVVMESAHSGARGVLDQLHRSVERWRESGAPDDDETVLVVSREGVAEGARVAGTQERLVGAVPGPERPQPGAVPGPLESEPAQVLRRFAEAERGGVSLCLAADLESMSLIGEWLERSGIVQGVSEKASGLLHLALYEVCANIAEHGYGEDPTHTIELWWAGRSGRPGTFFIRDQGKPFRPDGWKGPNFDDVSVRKRGRGLGLEIIHRAMGGVEYHPGTERGNITVMNWDPSKAQAQEKELRHA
jgi:serine phosphatase RsbU (regulator of sigma subunit)/anti-sigma regulatory factor (Ser/Thr protein kinase)